MEDEIMEWEDDEDHATPEHDVWGKIMEIEEKFSGIAVKPVQSIVDSGTKIEEIITTLKEGVDYGRIPGTKKDTLWRAGALKMCFQFNLQPTFLKDEETLSMLKDINNIIAYKCNLVDRTTGKIVGEGRGAAQLSGKQATKDVNGAIKMAQKSAEIDAVLRTFALYDRFAQAEDIEPKEQSKITIDEKGNISL